MDLDETGISTESNKKKRKAFEKEAFKPKHQSENDQIDTDEQFQLVKSVPFIYLIIDKEYEIIKLNDFAIQYFNLQSPDSGDFDRKLHINKLFNNSTALQNLLCKAFDGIKAKEEVCLEMDSSSPIWFDCHCSLVQRRDGSLTNVVSLVACDITDRKNQENTLRQSEAWLHQIYGDAPVMIYAIDDQAIIRHVNKKWLEQTGYSREEVVGEKIKLFLPEKSKEIVFGKVIPEFIRNGKVQNIELQILKKNGELMDVRFSAVKTTDISGGFLGLTVVEDITVVKRTRETLKETDEQYRKLVEGLPDVVIVTDIFGKIEYASPNFKTLPIHALVDDCVGSNFLTWINTNFHGAYLENMQRLVDGQDYVIGIYDFTDQIGKTVNIEVRSSQLSDAHGDPRGFISILRDITKEKKVEEQLKLNEQMLQQISDNSADIIWMMDKDDNITFVSKATENILGYTPEEAKKLSINVLQSPEDLEKKLISHRNKFPAIKKRGEIFNPIHLEVQHIHKNGSKVWTEMVSAPLYDEHDYFCGLIGIIRDNSERKATELAIRESQELYRSLIELSPEGIIIVKDGKIEFANREFIKMLKVEREKQIIERSFLDLVKLKDHANVRKWLKRVELFKSDNELILAELTRFDGETLFVEVMATPITIKGDKSAQLIVRDVTQRLLTEKELSKERELNDNLIKSIPDFIYFKDLKGNFIKINQAFAKSLRLSKPEDAIGKSDKDFFGIKHYQATQKEEKGIVNTKKPIIGAIREEAWNKGIKWVSVTKMPLYGPDRDVIGTYGISRDITKRKRAEEELRKREERFRQLFEQVQVGMAIIDSKLEILEVNNALCHLLDYRHKELINERILTLFKKSESDNIKNHIKLISSNKSDHFDAECKVYTKSGDPIYVILKIIKLDEVIGFKDHMLCQIVDINDRKEAEEQLLTRNNELNNFVYKVSHDLRAPLLSVKGLINLMGMEKDTTSQVNYIGMIEERVEKLDAFIRDILSHSKNLNTEVSIGEVGIREIVDGCFTQMQYHKNAKKIEKIVSIRGAKLYSDGQRLKEVMRNLISNAIIYCSQERLNSFVSVKVRCGQNLCTIVVEDNGTGIKKAYIDKIFQMFYRANDRVEGSGIGLYIVQQSINKLGGEVQVESKLNSGTKFTLTIPNHIP